MTTSRLLWLGQGEETGLMTVREVYFRSCLFDSVVTAAARSLLMQRHLLDTQLILLELK